MKTYLGLSNIEAMTLHGRDGNQPGTYSGGSGIWKSPPAAQPERFAQPSPKDFLDFLQSFMSGPCCNRSVFTVRMHKFFTVRTHKKTIIK